MREKENKQEKVIAGEVMEEGESEGEEGREIKDGREERKTRSVKVTMGEAERKQVKERKGR